MESLYHVITLSVVPRIVRALEGEGGEWVEQCGYVYYNKKKKQDHKQAISLPNSKYVDSGQRWVGGSKGVCTIFTLSIGYHVCP